MRKNTARHWLHAVLDLLPLILIPVFMIYSHRHTIDSGSIEVPQNIVVDFNQLYKGNGTTQTASGGTATFVNNEIDIVVDTSVTTDLYFAVPVEVTFDSSHLYYLKSNSNSNFQLYTYIDSAYTPITNNYVIPLNKGSQISTFLLTTNTTGYYTVKFNIYDVTQIFGDGNEPSTTDFANYYDSYYNYTASHKELLQVGVTNYNDTDIMSQFTYQLYNSVDKYFNMGNVFGMSNVYDWFNLNIFGGNASISIYIVWTIVLYEFVMDLLFLLYALFMWFIDVTKRLIEKPLDSIK